VLNEPMDPTELIECSPEEALEIAGEESPTVFRYFHGIGIPEDSYQALFQEFEDWEEMARWPEEQEQNRIRVYTELLSCLAHLAASDTGTDNGLDDLTEKSINTTIRAVLADVCRRVKRGNES